MLDKKPSLGARLCFGAVSGLMIAVCVTYLVGIGGGFDFTDEGVYYLNFAHPENVSDRQTTYFVIGGAVYSLLGGNLLALRVAAMLATIGGAILLARGFDRFITAFAPALRPQRVDRLTVLAAAIIASFAGYSISPPALSYNVQNALCLMAATGFLLRAASAPVSPRFWDAGTLLNLGGFAAMVGLEFFIKFSSSLPLAVGGVTFFLLVSRQSWRNKAILVTFVAGTASAMAAIYFLVMTDFAAWREGIAGTLTALTTGDFLANRLLDYRADIGELGGRILRNFAPVWVVALPAIGVVAVLRRWPRIQAAAAIVAGVWTCAHLIWLVDFFDYHVVLSIEFHVGCLTVLLAWAVASRWVRPGRHDGFPAALVLAGLLLLALPYVGALGTDNNLNNNALYQLAPWFLLAALLCADLGATWGTPWVSRIALTFMAVIAAAQFRQGYWFEPYRVTGNRSEQTEPTEIGFPATTLRLSPVAHEFVRETRRILDENGYQAGDDLLVFFDLPGWVFAMGGQSPGHPWYFGGEHSQEINLIRLGNLDGERKKRAFIIRHGEWDYFLPGLATLGIRIPEDYERISPPMLSPFTRIPFEIWKPRAAPSP
jgi:hypothetical protein